jgi:hypothetical protein
MFSTFLLNSFVGEFFWVGLALGVESQALVGKCSKSASVVTPAASWYDGLLWQ